VSLATTSLKRRGSDLSSSAFQLKVLHSSDQLSSPLPDFMDKIGEAGGVPFRPRSTKYFQINLGKMCNQTCKHCHVDAGPDRKEIMTRETMEACLVALSKSDVPFVDLTGGAPEMNPDFRWFVDRVVEMERKVMVRCNLTIIVANKKYHDLPDYYARHGVHVISSLPSFDQKNTDRQRGDGVFEESIRALKMLNAVGYGAAGSGLKLDLVYNPVGALLPGSQSSLQEQFKRILKTRHDVNFNDLICITNMPISRFLEYLLESGNYGRYMEELVNAFNPAAVDGVMCRDTLSIGWDGMIYDCDFNQMLDLPVASNIRHVADFDPDVLMDRDIVVDQHCYGCTAGAGSSCGGQITS
jgi:radical SAM/Cys-rich protein